MRQTRREIEKLLFVVVWARLCAVPTAALHKHLWSSSCIPIAYSGDSGCCADHCLSLAHSLSLTCSRYGTHSNQAWSLRFSNLKLGRRGDCILQASAVPYAIGIIIYCQLTKIHYTKASIRCLPARRQCVWFLDWLETVHWARQHTQWQLLLSQPKAFFMFVRSTHTDRDRPAAPAHTPTYRERDPPEHIAGRSYSHVARGAQRALQALGPRSTSRRNAARAQVVLAPAPKQEFVLRYLPTHLSVSRLVSRAACA